MSQTVALRLLINEQGLIDEVLVEGEPLSTPVERLIKDAFSKIQFEPGKIGNASVKSQLWIEVDLEVTGEHSP